ncbi:DUF4055 domain-containing protein [Gemmata sp. JC717]|uniref:DUF4055 domain-containing protein n=1 Tax=Gemmata algarum TaxID=2975278 RepID=UPI0021BBA7A5|nr:DUF4055 domain-containing protein [Gemmata algarum]MDY3551414.1 DUF4055 domain-containing protein [Gemmata algarum]
MLKKSEGDDVSGQSEQVSEMACHWPLIDALMGGTDAMRKAGKRLLPQWPAEEPDSYKTRLDTATLFPAYARTVSVLTGKPFSKPVTIGDDVPERIRALLDDIDLEGRNLHAFASDLCHNALSHGLCGILVDCPPAAGVRTLAEERAQGVRPYFVHVRNDAVLGWRAEKRGAAMVLTQLRLMECAEEPDGQFGTRHVPQVRVLEPGRWTTYRKHRDAAGNESWGEHESGNISINEVPFVPVYGFRKRFMVGAPPMLELAHLNVEHWQSKSDQQHILHVARVPILFTKDIGPETKLVVGAGSSINATGEHADMKYVEHSGKAIEAGRLSLLDLEDKMRQIGAELLVIKPGNLTVAQTVADNEPGMCDLQRIMQSVEDAIDQALDLMAKYLGEKEGGHVSIYSDFGVATLAEASAQLLFDMQAAGALSHATLLNELKRRGVLSSEVDVDAEIERAAAEQREALRQQEEIAARRKPSGATGAG